MAYMYIQQEWRESNTKWQNMQTFDVMQAFTVYWEQFSLKDISF